MISKMTGKYVKVSKRYTKMPKGINNPINFNTANR